MAKVSVIVPVYNTEKFLKQCLLSVCNQTLKEIEILCINDGSTDGSAEILKEFAGNDKRIKVIELFENGGAAKARNIGLDLAQGEYIGFVDSDDYVDLDFYEKLYKKADETQADAVKGELWEINDTSLQLPAVYDLNNFIRKNKAYFYYTFTSAIFKKDFLDKHNIRFPEGLCHLEDPYFTIKAGLYYNKLEICVGAKYYYVVTTPTREKKPEEGAIITSIKEGILKIMDLINSGGVSKEHYLVITSFLLSQITDRINNYTLPDSSYNELLSGMYEIFEGSNYKEELLPVYYSIKKQLFLAHTKQERFITIRNNSKPLLLKEYKKFDYLNKDKNLVKILVSYIKPDFLFKSEILTPIHLGRSVEKTLSKDGNITDEDIEWLHENCIGDDDFEGSISAVNRRVGFLTGTYMAWKNYDRLGNPEYFGSFGYRKLLDPQSLAAISNTDGILPHKVFLGESVGEQFAISHGKAALDIMKQLIKKLYPEEFEDFDRFLQGNECCLYENYILKKDLFFSFCGWIFPLLFEALRVDEKEFEISPEEKLTIIDYFHEPDGESICNYKNFESYQKRVLGFMFERITGYFFSKAEKKYQFLHTNCRIFPQTKTSQEAV